MVGIRERAEDGGRNKGHTASFAECGGAGWCYRYLGTKVHLDHRFGIAGCTGKIVPLPVRIDLRAIFIPTVVGLASRPIRVVHRALVVPHEVVLLRLVIESYPDDASKTIGPQGTCQAVVLGCCLNGYQIGAEILCKGLRLLPCKPLRVVEVHAACIVAGGKWCAAGTDKRLCDQRLVAPLLCLGYEWQQRTQHSQDGDPVQFCSDVERTE